MSPNLEDQIPNYSEIEPNNEHIHLTLTPLSDLSVSTSISEGNQSDSESNDDILVDDLADVVVTSALRNYIPLEHNIRELLVRVANTDHLETVTQIKLRVIARELALQQLGIYLPALRELTLDGSIISSLRDLGYGLKNLKILKINRCQLTCIDGVLGFEYLEELYAADNNIKDLSPCAFLSDLRVIDVRRNLIRHLGSLSFLNLCPDLAHVLLDGNEVTQSLASYCRIVGRMLPNLELLDGQPLIRDSDDQLLEDIAVEDLEKDDDDYDDPQNVRTPEAIKFTSGRLATLPRPNPRSHDGANEFSIRFPPRVCGSNDNGGKSA